MKIPLIFSEFEILRPYLEGLGLSDSAWDAIERGVAMARRRSLPEETTTAYIAETLYDGGSLRGHHRRLWQILRRDFVNGKINLLPILMLMGGDWVCATERILNGEDFARECLDIIRSEIHPMLRRCLFIGLGWYIKRHGATVRISEETLRRWVGVMVENPATSYIPHLYSTVDSPTDISHLPPLKALAICHVTNDTEGVHRITERMPEISTLGLLGTPLPRAWGTFGTDAPRATDEADEADEAGEAGDALGIEVADNLETVSSGNEIIMSEEHAIANALSHTLQFMLLSDRLDLSMAMGVAWLSLGRMLKLFVTDSTIYTRKESYVIEQIVASYIAAIDIAGNILPTDMQFEILDVFKRLYKSRPSATYRSMVVSAIGVMSAMNYDHRRSRCAEVRAAALSFLRQICADSSETSTIRRTACDFVSSA